MKLIGISGTNGSGKDSLGEVLAKYHGWLFISVTRDMLRKEAKKRGLPIERKNLRFISAEWRREGGLGVLVDKAFEEFQAKGGFKRYKGLAIASLRNPGEVTRIHELGGKLIWVDAHPKLRFQRVMARKRGTEDAKTYEQFLTEEQEEMQPHGGDAAVLNMAAVKEISDIFLQNNSNSIATFRGSVEAELKEYL